MIWPILHPKSFVAKYLVFISVNSWINLSAFSAVKYKSVLIRVNLGNLWLNYKPFLKKQTQFFPFFSPKTAIWRKNEPKTKPNQSQFKPNSKPIKPNFSA